MIEHVYDTSNVLTTFTASTPVKDEPKYEPYSLISKDTFELNYGTAPFNFDNFDVDPEEFASRLIETAKRNNAFAVAGNQCGLPYRVFVMGVDEFVAFFNPKIITSSKAMMIFPEVDLLDRTLMLKVKRPKSIHLEYQDFNGETHVKEFVGMTANIIQHNIDRLDGVPFEASVSSLKLERSKKAQDKRNKKLVRTLMRQIAFKPDTTHTENANN